MNWISWPAPLDHISGRADPFGQVVADGVEAGAVAAGDNELWKGGGRQLGQRSLHSMSGRRDEAVENRRLSEDDVPR